MDGWLCVYQMAVFLIAEGLHGFGTPPDGSPEVHIQVRAPIHTLPSIDSEPF